MRTSITRLIRPRGEYLYTSNGRYREAGFIRKGGFHVPRTPYKVTFTLHERGQFRVEYEWLSNYRGNGFYVCFLPHEWTGMHVTRTVRVLNAKAR